jgi:hypothetical protein
MIFLNAITAKKTDKKSYTEFYKKAMYNCGPGKEEFN